MKINFGYTGSAHRLPRQGALAAALFCAGAAFCSPASSYDWKFSTSYNYDTGKYGTSIRTNTSYVPFTLKRYFDDASLALTVPYVSQKSNGQVVNIGGTPFLVKRAGGGTTTQSGIGDVILRGTYAAVKEGPQPFDLALVGKIKFPAADKNKGLGTGKYDEGAGLEFGKKLQADLTLLADFYYTAIGSPSGLKLRDQKAFDLGFFYLARKDLTLTVLYETSNALLRGNTAPRDLRGILEYTARPFKVYAGATAGLSKGSPDFGFSLGGSIRF